MGLTLSTLAVFICIAILNALVIPRKWREWVLFVLSVVFVYSLQPDIFVRWLDFTFPTFTLGLIILCWYVTRSSEQMFTQEDRISIAIAAVLIVALALFRYIPVEYDWLLASRPPPLWLVLSLLGMFGVLMSVSHRKRSVLAILLIGIITIFVVLKTEFFATAVSASIRGFFSQDVSQAQAIDLNWLGFSYVAFRLLHMIRDRQVGVLPEIRLRDAVTYVAFFPSFTAGPIDRIERFQEDLRPGKEIDYAKQFTTGLTRIAVGVAKKFIIADTLALGMSLNAITATQADSSIGMWILLYGYALRLYFDFSGYSDIAIGVGMLFGINLPENFARPYTRTSITAFWQSWHITLSDWVRTYIFSPLSRWLLKRRPKPSPMLIVLTTQVTT
ncbi:MAG: MBOAT family O-acyltransferase, partial [Chloroflexota bacterium]